MNQTLHNKDVKEINLKRILLYNKFFILAITISCENIFLPCLIIFKVNFIKQQIKLLNFLIVLILAKIKNGWIILFHDDKGL